MARSRRFLAVSIIAVALAAACTEQDADRDDVISALEDADVDPDQAECVADRLDDELDQGQLNEVRDASEIGDLDDDLEPIVQATLDECIGGAPSGGDTDTTEGDEPGDESTTTTEG